MEILSTVNFESQYDLGTDWLRKLSTVWVLFWPCGHVYMFRGVPAAVFFMHVGLCLGTGSLGRGTRCAQLRVDCALHVAEFERNVSCSSHPAQSGLLSFLLWGLIVHAPKLLHLPCKTKLACCQVVRFAGLFCMTLSTKITFCLVI